jgi:heme oxygenase (biliverdin-producing, ferredoxin)
MSVNLASKLREGTQKAHTMAENTTFMKTFVKGIVEKEPFRKLIANLYLVYSALEAELQRHRDHSLVGPMYFPELNRKENLEEDLKYYYGDNWRDQIHASNEGKDFVNRIHEVANTEPALLVAHAYVRYMGDLSGGQGLKHITRSGMNLPPDRGTRFFEFDEIASIEAIKTFKTKYRDALDSLPIDEALAEKIVAEANLAFELNRNVLQGLEEDVKAAIGDRVFEQVSHQVQAGSTENLVTK